MEFKTKDILLVGLGLILGVFFYNNRKRSITNDISPIVNEKLDCDKKRGNWDEVEHFCMPNGQ
jgi:hypothetical protein